MYYPPGSEVHVRHKNRTVAIHGPDIRVVIVPKPPSLVSRFLAKFRGKRA